MIETRATTGAALRAGFDRVDQRFVHTLSVVLGEQSTPLLTAVGDAPVFQELHVQGDSPGDAIAFLTGMANHRYWSASMAPGAAPAVEIVLDLACRTKRAPAAIALRYALSPDVEATTVEGAIRLAAPGAPACVLAPALADSLASCRLSLLDRELRVEPLACAESVQWGLRLMLAEC